MVSYILAIIGILSSVAADPILVNSNCTRSCNGTYVDYPFGFSPGCEFILNCTHKGRMEFHGFAIRNISSSTISLMLLPNCTRPITEIWNLFGLNYAVTSQNQLLLQNCSTPLNECIIRSSSTKIGFRWCDAGIESMGCYSREDESNYGILSYAEVENTFCRVLLSSIVEEDFDGGDDGFGTVLQFNTIQLWWWMTGTCRCDDNAICNTVGATGFRCQCNLGFTGDGFVDGKGCHNVSMVNIRLGRGNKVHILIGVLSSTFGSILLLLFGWWFGIFIKRRRDINQRGTYFEKNGGLLLQQKISNNEGTIERTQIFNIEELKKATDNFSESRILGQGGHGTVYKGMLGEGRLVAIKKSKIVDESEQGEFINEVIILSQVNHRNIVKLLGCCLESEIPLLVFEFIPNGTLFQHLHYPNEEFEITWRMRQQISLDTARAISFLHSSSSVPIFHRDIKSSNILLDDKYRAKLSDFGTSRLMETSQTHITTRVMGTLGYLDPEYFQSSQFTEKSDVYSFGVVLVELLTGQKAIRAISEKDRSLVAWFLSHMENSSLLDIVDSQVLKKGPKEGIYTMADLAKRCLHLDGKRRPTMKEVLLILEIQMSSHFKLSHTNKAQPRP